MVRAITQPWSAAVGCRGSVTTVLSASAQTDAQDAGAVTQPVEYASAMAVGRVHLARSKLRTSVQTIVLGPSVARATRGQATANVTARTHGVLQLITLLI